MSNNKIRIGLIIFFTLTLSLACGSATKLMTLNFNQEILFSILYGVKIPSSEQGYSFTIMELSVQPDYLHIEGEFNSETEEKNEGFIDFDVLAEEGKLIFGIRETNISEIKSEEIIGNEIANNLANFLYQYLAKDRNEIEIIAVDFVDDVIRIRIRYLE